MTTRSRELSEARQNPSPRLNWTRHMSPISSKRSMRSKRSIYEQISISRTELSKLRCGKRHRRRSKSKHHNRLNQLNITSQSQLSSNNRRTRLQRSNSSKDCKKEPRFSSLSHPTRGIWVAAPHSSSPSPQICTCSEAILVNWTIKMLRERVGLSAPRGTFKTTTIATILWCRSLAELGPTIRHRRWKQALQRDFPNNILSSNCR